MRKSYVNVKDLSGLNKYLQLNASSNRIKQIDQQTQQKGVPNKKDRIRTDYKSIKSKKK